MYHMKQATVRDLRYDFPRIEKLLAEGEPIEITKRKRVVARIIPPGAKETVSPMPDFLGRMKKIYGGRTLKISWVDFLADRKGRF
jgi:antitoxin (DNA-binding transcriptional repressor) of toxin-antitoxin stability system